MRQRLDRALTSASVRHETVTGWEACGGENFAPQGIVLHHTASASASTTTLIRNLVMNGRPDVPGPLCNIYIDRRGAVYLISAGKANHAGRNSSIALAEMAAGKVNAATKSALSRALVDDAVGNSSSIGIEIDNNGIG
jgi:hypothetical protein